jgi:DNA-binding transcriptional LysR family regulator
MDWDKLRIFHAVADAGSFTHAGHELGLSQSAVSRQISALEDALNVPLFHRHARGLILTEQAALFYGEGAERERIESGIPMGRFAMPSDVGDIAVYLASDLAGYVTGAEIAAHGGGERPPFLGAD